MDRFDNFTAGWVDANEAIKHHLPGYRDFSQGDTAWDRGWNARMSEPTRCPMHGDVVCHLCLAQGLEW